MIPIPSSDWRNPQVLASWVELSALAEDDGFAVRGAIFDTLKDSNLLGDKSANGGASGDSSTEGSAASVVMEIWRALKERETILLEAWPFILSENSLSRKPEQAKLGTVSAYTAMLLIEAAGNGWYENLAINPNESARTNFEFIVEASLSRLCKGCTTRFGAPFPKNWPKKFPERVKCLADHFQVKSIGENITDLASISQQDGSLDIVARLKLGDEHAASPYILVQCATGEKWLSEKTGEPKIEFWKKLISWNGPVVKAVAVPYTLRDSNKLFKASTLHDAAIIFDRIRISCGHPDATLDAKIKKSLTIWCRKKLALISCVA